MSLSADAKNEPHSSDDLYLLSLLSLLSRYPRCRDNRDRWHQGGVRHSGGLSGSRIRNPPMHHSALGINVLWMARGGLNAECHE
jgi:hypothetical protein